MLDLLEEHPPELVAAPAENAFGARNAVEAARHLSVTLGRYAAEADEGAAIAPASLAALHAAGLPLAVFSPAHGGQGLLDRASARQLSLVLRLIGAGDLSIARLFEGHVNAVALVQRFGTARQARDLAEAVRHGGLSAVWNAEGREPLTAMTNAQGLELSGQKILASGLGTISHPIVTPRSDAGVLMVLLDRVDAGRADLSAWTPMGMRASATGTIDLSGTRVPGAAQIGAPGDYLRQPWFSGGAWRFCAVHLGAAERLLDLFRDHLCRRRRADDPYQKQRIAAATAACVTARFWVDHAACLLASGDEPAASIVAFANLTRSVTERACLDVLEAVQRGVGLGAFMRPDPIERIARDLATYLRQPVPDAAMADAAAHVLASDTPAGDLWSA